MSKRNKDNLAKKIAEINSLWDNEERFVDFMPSREMYCHLVFDDSGESDYPEICTTHPGQDCLMPDMTVFSKINLDSNTDWLQWELEMME